jgi:hypothetical protein
VLFVCVCVCVCVCVDFAGIAHVCVDRPVEGLQFGWQHCPDACVYVCVCARGSTVATPVRFFGVGVVTG